MKRIAYVWFLLCLAFSAVAQDWPAKPVKFVVPFPPGGSVDPLARLLAGKLSESLKQQFIVENKPGASGSIGTAQVVAAAADGYTFVVVFETHAVNPALMPKLPFDTLKDLAPVMLIGTAPIAIATQTAKPYRTFPDVIAAAKAKPESLAFGTIGNGSLGHLTMVLVEDAAGISLLHVPYKGGGAMIPDAIGGQLELAVASVAAIAPHVKSGKLRPLAITGDKRSQAMPDVPTLAELGFKGFSAHSWWGVFAPASTAQPIIQKLNAELAKVLHRPEVQSTLIDTLGMDLAISTPEALQKWTVSEMQRWGKVVRENHNIKLD
jgi:tripartite-type tricarboxylate transporter receptor subunit TctC